MKQTDSKLDKRFYRDLIRLLERFWSLPELHRQMDRLAGFFWTLYEEISLCRGFQARGRTEPDSEDDTTEDPIPDEDILLTPEDAVFAYLEEKNWEPLQPDDDRPIYRARREKTVYECLDEQYLGNTGRKSEAEPLGMFKFTDDGECLVIHGDRWNAIAWELDQLYQGPAAPSAIMSQTS